MAAMRVLNHRLILADGRPAPYAGTPNLGAGELQPEYLVMHYTAGRDLEGAVRWLTNPAAGVSAHLVIGRQGRVVQLAPFNRVTLHAGRSHWNGQTGLNQFAIGIELDNPGRLERREGRWLTWFGLPVEDADVIEAQHRHQPTPSGWHAFSAPQLEAAMAVARVLVAHYRLREVLGHDDIAPGRKQDPGPAFPMEQFRTHVLSPPAETGLIVETCTHLNIRTGPGVENPRLAIAPLPPGTLLKVLGHHDHWQRVEVVSSAAAERVGWVHGDYVRPLTT